MKVAQSKMLGVLALAAGLVAAGAASAHSHQMSFNNGGMSSGQTGDSNHFENDKTNGGSVTGDTKWMKSGDDKLTLTHHEWRKEEHREHVVRRLEERRVELEREIVKLKALLVRNPGEVVPIKLEILRIEGEISKIATVLGSGETPV